jgi:hypothetical protein
MSANGSRRPPRPHIEMLGGAPSAEQGAAIVAALEQFLAETAVEPAPEPQSRWQRAALVGGVDREPRLARWGAQP